MLVEGKLKLAVSSGVLATETKTAVVLLHRLKNDTSHNT